MPQAQRLDAAWGGRRCKQDPEGRAAGAARAVLSPRAHYVLSARTGRVAKGEKRLVSGSCGAAGIAAVLVTPDGGGTEYRL